MIVGIDPKQLHVLEIPKFNLSAEELRTPLERWVYFLKHGAELDTEQLPQALHGPAYRQALEEMKQMTQSDVERERYESRLKAQRDVATALREARSEGLAEGRSEGLAEGRSEGLAEGLVIGQIHLCQRLLGRTLTATEQLRALPLTELQRLAQELEVELTRGHGTRS